MKGTTGMESHDRGVSPAAWPRGGASAGTGGMTRARLLALSLSPIGVAFAACGSGQPTTANPASSPSAQPVTLQWSTDWTSGARGEATNLSIPAFQAQFPHIKLDMRANQADAYQAFASNLAAGTLADVMLFSGNFFEYWADQNVLADISAHLKTLKFDKDSVWWDPQFFENKGKTHGLPYQFIINTWLYNKTWFARDGVAPPTDAWTTADLQEAGRKLTHASASQWGTQMMSTPAYAWPWLYANDVDLTSYTEPIRTIIDSPKQIDVFQYAVDLISRHEVAPLLEGPQGLKGLSFDKGNFAMTVNNGAKSLGATIKDQFQWDVMPTPRWAGTKRRVTQWQHQAHVVTKAAEQRGHVDAAVQFGVWMAGAGGQEIVARTGGATPVHKKTALGPLYLDGTPPGLKLQLDLLTKTNDQSARAFRIWRHFQEWYTAVNPILVEGFSGAISVREMAVKANAAGNAALAAVQK